MTDCCVIGGGVVGLSIARELAGRGLSVHVLTRERRRDTASWAAAGILPAAPAAPGPDPAAALTALSDALLSTWAADLDAETGVDVGLRACGGLHVATSAADADRLRDRAGAWRRTGIDCEWLDPTALAACAPALATAAARGALRGGVHVPGERQIRPSRLLAALERSCGRRGVVVTCGAVAALDVAGGRVAGVVADRERARLTVQAAHYVLAAGAWTEAIAGPLGLRIATRPIRGQIVLLRPPRRLLGCVVSRGLDYLVPRDDGRLLVGSTLEDAGFDTATTAVAVDRLRRLARNLLGGAADVPVERAWAGLRPGSADGLPTIGHVPGVANALVAAGHFRAGIHWSAGTAQLVADLVTGRPPALDPACFAADRAVAPGPDAAASVLARTDDR